MKKTTILATLFIAICGVLFLNSCKDDDKPTAAAEFIADDNTFAGFENWTLNSTKLGIDPSLGMAHAGNDSTAKREIYFKDNVAPANGVYPVGALIVKHTSNKDGSIMYTGMAKRGNNFDAAANDWEYFIIESSGKIVNDPTKGILRGSALNNGGCRGCHSKATIDYVFDK